MVHHELDYEILGESMQLVELELRPGESVIAEAGAMNYMDSGIHFEAKMGDGSAPDQGLLGRVVTASRRLFSGESLFLTHFINQAGNKKRVAFSAPYPGRIVPLNLGRIGKAVMCQKDAFLAASLGTRVSVAHSQRLGSGFFGGEGFILQRLEGRGMAFVHAGGYAVEKVLKGDPILVDAGCLVGFEAGIEFSIQRAGGLKSMFFGNEGFYLAKLEGHGSVWLQSLPFSRLADRVLEQAPRAYGTHPRKEA